MTSCVAAGYPFRYTYKDFCRRYHMLKAPEAQYGPWLPDGRFVSGQAHHPNISTFQPSAPVFKEFAGHIIDRLRTEGILTPTAFADVKYGITMVLYRSEANKIIEVRPAPRTECTDCTDTCRNVHRSASKRSVCMQPAS